MKLRSRLSRGVGLLTATVFPALWSSQLHVDEDAIRLKWVDDSTFIDLPIHSTLQNEALAEMGLAVVMPQGSDRLRLASVQFLKPGTNVVTFGLGSDLAELDPAEVPLHRIHYRVASPPSAPPEPESSVLISDITKTSFELQADHSGVLGPESQYRVGFYATDSATGAPVGDVTIRVLLQSGGDTLRRLFCRTDSTGHASIDLIIPPEEIPTERATLHVTGRLSGCIRTRREPVRVSRRR